MDPTSIHRGPISDSWSDFRLTPSTQSFACDASYLGLHPVQELVPLAVDLTEHVGESPWPADTVAEVEIIDEPGGLRLEIRPAGADALQVAVFPGDHLLDANASAALPREPIGQARVAVPASLQAVHQVATETSRRHGIAGFGKLWARESDWLDRPKHTLFPWEHCVQLSVYMAGTPLGHRAGNALEWEVRCLSAILSTPPTDDPHAVAHE